MLKFFCHTISTFVNINLICTRKNLKTKVFLFLLLLSEIVHANITANLKSFASDFTQTIVNEQNAHITYKGKLYAIKANNQAVWIYTSPVNKKIYYTNGKVVILEPELEQAIFAKLDKVPNILTLLKEAKKIGENKYVTTFNKIRYTITFDGEKLSKITYTDELRNRVQILFSNQKTDIKIPQNTFRYTIPEDYDILRQR